MWIHPEKANAVDWSQVPLQWFQWFPIHDYITETAHVLFTFLFLCTLALSEGLRASVFQIFFLKNTASLLRWRFSNSVWLFDLILALRARICEFYFTNEHRYGGVAWYFSKLNLWVIMYRPTAQLNAKQEAIVSIPVEDQEDESSPLKPKSCARSCSCNICSVWIIKLFEWTIAQLNYWIRIRISCDLKNYADWTKADSNNCCGVIVMKESSNSFKDGKQSMITLKFGNTKVYLKNVGVRDSFELESRSLLVLGIEEKLGM